MLVQFLIVESVLVKERLRLRSRVLSKIEIRQGR